mgnify:CR=1 FL=1
MCNTPKPKMVPVERDESVIHRDAEDGILLRDRCTPRLLMMKEHNRGTRGTLQLVSFRHNLEGVLGLHDHNPRHSNQLRTRRAGSTQREMDRDPEMTCMCSQNRQNTHRMIVMMLPCRSIFKSFSLRLPDSPVKFTFINASFTYSVQS